MSWDPAKLKKDNRVTLLKLDGIGGTVTRIRDDGRVAVLADCAAQSVVWDRADLGPPRMPSATRVHSKDTED